MVWVLGIPLVLIAAAFLYWQLSSGPSTFRYKMTVEVMTPEGLRTGFAVREVKVPEPATWFPFGEDRGTHRRLTGEAVAVDLPSGATLFALLSGANGHSDYAKSMPFRALGPKEEWEVGLDPVELWPSTPPLPAFRRVSALPMFVTFKDVADPTSVELVDPDHLAKSFGEGVSLKRVAVQVTAEPVTSGIAERLIWFQSVRNSGGGLIPMVRGKSGRYETRPGVDVALASIGLSSFSTEAYR